MDNNEFIEEMSLPQRESMLRLARELERIDQELKNGKPTIPVEKTIARMEAAVEEQRRKQKHG